VEQNEKRGSAVISSGFLQREQRSTGQIIIHEGCPRVWSLEIAHSSVPQKVLKALTKNKLPALQPPLITKDGKSRGRKAVIIFPQQLSVMMPKFRYQSIEGGKDTCWRRCASAFSPNYYQPPWTARQWDSGRGRHSIWRQTPVVVTPPACSTRGHHQTKEEALATASLRH
jgi:hypothetical protein